MAAVEIIPRDMFEKFCGTNTESFLKFYDSAAETWPKAKYAPNIGAILVFPFWALYRKMLALPAVIFTAVFVIGMIEILFKFELPNSAFLGVNIFLGLLGNWFYVQHASVQYNKLKNSVLTPAQLDEELARKGGVSVPLIFAGIGVLVATVFVLVFIEMMVSAPM